MSEYINKQQAIDLIESMIADKGVAFNPHKLAMALKDMESVEIPEAKDTDLISRQTAIELACWRCKKCERQDCEYKDSCKTMELLDALPSEDVKPPMLNKDCIPRQAAIDAVEKAVFKGVAKSAIESLPPVEPKRPKGEWVDRIFDGCLKKECDQCGEMIDAYIFRQNRYNFCPNCGADMIGR